MFREAERVSVLFVMVMVSLLLLEWLFQLGVLP